MSDFDFKKPPTGYSISKWGKNAKPHLFIEQPGISVACALFQSKEMAKYFDDFLTIALDGDSLQSSDTGVKI